MCLNAPEAGRAVPNLQLTQYLIYYAHTCRERERERERDRERQRETERQYKFRYTHTEREYKFTLGERERERRERERESTNLHAHTLRESINLSTHTTYTEGDYKFIYRKHHDPVLERAERALSYYCMRP